MNRRDPIQFHHSPCPAVLLLLAVAGLGWMSHAVAAGLTVSPASITNTYSGAITLQISGLTNGETVLIERFLDPNNNTAVDAGEPLLQSVRLTDGQTLSFGGVRDNRVPGDDDGAVDAQIRTGLNFAAAPEFARLVGTQLFRLSSPTGRFTPVIQPFTITQTAAPQSVTGQISGGGSPAPYAAVGLLRQTGDEIEFVAGTVADAAGNYSLNAAAGDYLLLGVKSGFVADFSLAPPFTINAGQVATQNVTLTTATRTISGRIADAATSNGIPGVQLFIDSDINAVTIGFSDIDGNFTLPVLAGQWAIDLSGFSLAQTGYLSPQDEALADTTTGNVTGILILPVREEALIYGTLKNDTNAPLPAISFFCNDSNNQYQSETITDAAGNYVVGVNAGTWFVGPDNINPGLAGYVVQGTNVTVATGQAIRIDFVARRSTAHLLGRILDASGSPMPGLTLFAFNQNGGSSSATTAADGSFDLGVFGGTWTLQLETSGAAQRNVIGPSLTYNVTDGVNVTNINYIVQTVTAQITGWVRDNLGSGLAGVFVNADTTINGTNYYQNASTDGSGNYQLGVINGTWQVGVDCFGLNNRGYACPAEQNITVSGANQTANFTAQAFSNTPPTLSQLQLSPSQFRFRINGEEGRDYRVEATTDFVGWASLLTNRVIGGSFEFNDSPGPDRRFYRASLVP